MKIKRECDICDEVIPAYGLSVHRRNVHKIGKPTHEVTPRGPNKMRTPESLERNDYGLFVPMQEEMYETDDIMLKTSNYRSEIRAKIESDFQIDSDE